MNEFSIRPSANVRRAARFLFALRLPIAIAAVLIGFYFVPQVHEFAGVEMVAGDTAHFAMSWAAALLYLITFRNVFLSPASSFSLQPPASSSIAEKTLAWGTLGLTGGAVAIFNALLWSEGLAWSFVVLAAILAWLASTAVLVLMRGIASRRKRPLPSEENHEFNVIFIGLVLLAALTVATIANGVALSKDMGPLALVFVFLSLLLLIFSPLDFWLSRYSIPFYTVLLFFAFFATQAKYGEDHQLRRLASGPTLKELREQGIGSKSLPETFAEWLKCRPGFADYVSRKKPYPVFVVAVEGGGTYAAVHANSVLSKLTAKDPNFPEHTFMISAVSGGAIGAAAYSASISMTAPQPRPATCGEAAATQSNVPGIKADSALSAAQASEVSRLVATSDYLSPVVAGAVFPNFVQRFLPYSEPSLDRARWLEFGIEDTWQQALAGKLGKLPEGNVFKDDYFTFWKPSAHYPGLVINMVGAEDGFPMFLSPFDRWTTKANTDPAIPVAQLQTSPIRSYLEYTESGRGVSLSTAVGIAARFPYVFGPAVVMKTRKDGSLDPQHFVDGGYYDVTGVNSAALIYAYLYTEERRIASLLGMPEDTRLFDINLIMIGSFANAVSGTESSIFRGVLFPIETLNNTRAARAANTFALSEVFAYRQIQFKLAPDNYPFPLGLYVKPTTAEAIDARTGNADDCPSLEKPGELRAKARTRKLSEADIKTFNSCSLFGVHELLKQ